MCPKTFEWTEKEAAKIMLEYVIFYFIFCFCFVFPPSAFVSIGESVNFSSLSTRQDLENNLFLT